MEPENNTQQVGGTETPIVSQPAVTTNNVSVIPASKRSGLLMKAIIAVAIVGIIGGGYFVFGKNPKKQIEQNKVQPTETVQTQNIQSTNNNYQLVIEFNSIGAGIEQDQLKNFENILSGYDSMHTSQIDVKEVGWGKEGEIDYCMNFSQLTAAERDAFMQETKEKLKTAKQVTILENAPCKESLMDNQIIENNNNLQTYSSDGISFQYDGIAKVERRAHDNIISFQVWGGNADPNYELISIVSKKPDDNSNSNPVTPPSKLTTTPQKIMINGKEFTYSSPITAENKTYRMYTYIGDNKTVIMATSGTIQKPYTHIVPSSLKID